MTKNIENNEIQLSNLDILKQDMINEWISISDKDFWEFSINWKVIVFAIKNDNPSYCIIENWIVKWLLNQKWLDKYWKINEYISYTDYVRIWKYFYNKQDIINWRPKDWVEKINPKSEEYYYMLSDISFYDNAFYRSEIIKRAENWKWWEFIEKYIDDYVNWRNIKLKEFLYLKQEWLINDDLYSKYLPQVIDNLLEQCADTRYDVFKWEKDVWSVEVRWDKLVAVENAAQDIWEEEIKFYYQKWYISWDVAKKALNIIEARKRRDTEKEKVINETKKSIESNLK